MRKINNILVFLISNIAITGISFIDGKIWDKIFLVVGMIAYSMVGTLFSIGLLHGRKAGKKAYALVFFLLILGGIEVHKTLTQLRLWIIDLQLSVKILIPLIIGVITISSIILIVIHKNKRVVHKLIDNKN